MKEFKNYMLITTVVIILPFIHIGILKLFIDLEDNYIVDIINTYIASAIVLWGVLLTINQSKKQDKESFRLEHMPYLEIDYNDGIPNAYNASILFGEHEGYNHEVIGILKISNNGFGPAIGLSLTNISFDYQELSVSLMNEKILKPSDEIDVLLRGFFILPSLDNQTIESYHPNDFRTSPLYFDLGYKDFLGNEYIDEVKIMYSIVGEYDELGNATSFSIRTDSINKKRVTTKVS